MGNGFPLFLPLYPKEKVALHEYGKGGTKHGSMIVYDELEELRQALSD